MSNDAQNKFNFENMQVMNANDIAARQTIFSEYVASGNPFLINPEHVERIEVVRNRFDKSTQPVQQQYQGRRNSVMAQFQMMFASQSDTDDKHVRELQIAVSFNLKSGHQGVAYYGLCDSMRPYIENGKIYEGLVLSPNDVAFQHYVHRELKDIDLAFINEQVLA